MRPDKASSSAGAAVLGQNASNVLPAPGLLDHVQCAAELGHDAVHGRQAEAGSAAHRLGGEEGFENVLQRRGFHAVAGVAHRKAHMRPGHKVPCERPRSRDTAMFSSAISIVPRPSIACAALVQRFITTCCSSVGSPWTAAPPASRLRSQRDGGGQRGANEIHCLCDDRLNENGAALPLAPAAEGEHLVDDVSRAFRRLEDLMEMPARIRGRCIERHFGRAQDDAEDVVELVRDSAGERAHGLQALRLREPRLQRLAFRLAPLALDGVGEYFGGRAQQRDVVVPPFLHAQGVESEKADALAGSPYGDAQPCADAALQQPDLSAPCGSAARVDPCP